MLTYKSIIGFFESIFKGILLILFLIFKNHFKKLKLIFNFIMKIYYSLNGNVLFRQGRKSSILIKIVVPIREGTLVDLCKYLMASDSFEGAD